MNILYQGTICILISSVDPVMAFTAFFSLQYRNVQGQVLCLDAMSLQTPLIQNISIAFLCLLQHFYDVLERHVLCSPQHYPFNPHPRLLINFPHFRFVCCFFMSTFRLCFLGWNTAQGMCYHIWGVRYPFVFHWCSSFEHLVQELSSFFTSLLLCFPPLQLISNLREDAFKTMKMSFSSLKLSLVCNSH